MKLGEDLQFVNNYITSGIIRRYRYEIISHRV